MLRIILDIVTVLGVLIGSYFFLKYLYGKDHKYGKGYNVVQDLFKDCTTFKNLFNLKKDKSKKAKDDN
jgi:hypothetical protein